MEKKKIRRRKFNFLKFIIFILIIYIIFNIGKNLITTPIKNIIVTGNYYLSDDDIIYAANLENYPSFVKTMPSKICSKLKKNELIKSCKSNKTWGYKLTIEIEENKILFMSRTSGLYIITGGKEINLEAEYNGVPSLINYVPDDIKEKLIKKIDLVEIKNLSKVSEIEYSPMTYDDERFILYMNDGNMVYITLSKMANLNKYDEIKTKLDNHMGILYLDSGNYFEIKE